MGGTELSMQQLTLQNSLPSTSFRSSSTLPFNTLVYARLYAMMHKKYLNTQMQGATTVETFNDAVVSCPAHTYSPEGATALRGTEEQLRLQVHVLPTLSTRGNLYLFQAHMPLK